MQSIRVCNTVYRRTEISLGIKSDIIRPGIIMGNASHKKTADCIRIYKTAKVGRVALVAGISLALKGNHGKKSATPHIAEYTPLWKCSIIIPPIDAVGGTRGPVILENQVEAETHSSPGTGKSQQDVTGPGSTAVIILDGATSKVRIGGL